jgi:hypothetical protein
MHHVAEADTTHAVASDELLVDYPQKSIVLTEALTHDVVIADDAAVNESEFRPRLLHHNCH